MRPILLAISLIAAALAYAWLVPQSGIPTWLSLRAEVTQAEQRIHALQRQNDQLRDEVAALQRDPFAQERAVREELGWVRPGEILVRAPSDAAATAQSIP